MTDLTLSPLAHTWLIDVDGVVMRHNGHKAGRDEVLPGVHAFWAQIPPADTIILLTARTDAEGDALAQVLQAESLRFDRIVTGLPMGERVVINDRKPSGLVTCHAVDLARDAGLGAVRLAIDPAL